MRRNILFLAALAATVFAQPVMAQRVEYIHTDALGSIVAVTDESGQVVERRSYEPYGANISPSAQGGPGYSGHVEDAETGLTYMQQRYYDAALGRFLSSDPVGAGKDGGNFNRYSYVANNPYSAIDPDGRYLCKGGKDLCAGVKSALKSIKQSAKQQTGTRIRDSRSSQVANFYGAEGVDNGVVVNERSGSFYGIAETSGRTTTVGFNMQAMASMASGVSGVRTQDILNATVLHEGSHGIDQRQRLIQGLPSMTASRSLLRAGEVRAYRAEAAYHESLQARSPWGYWEPGTGRDEMTIQREADSSVTASCGIGKCTK